MTLSLTPEAAANVLLYKGARDGWFTLTVGPTSVFLNPEEASKLADYLKA